MQRPNNKVMSSRTRSSSHNDAQYYPLHGYGGYSNPVLYQVVPAGRNFFHIREVISGRVKGFRSDHIQACELAKKLEAILQQPDGAIVSSA
ncbi:hypothetical protein [Pseudomonas graminis]